MSTAIKTFKPLLFYLRGGTLPEGGFPQGKLPGVIFRGRTIFGGIFPDTADDITVLGANPNRILSLKNTLITLLKRET